MKKIAFGILFFASLKMHAQTPITLDRTDFPCPTTAQCGIDDSVQITNILPSASATVNVTGANSNWDYTTLSGGTSSFQKFVPVSGTPALFQLTFLGSDFATPLLGNQAVAGLPITDAFEYYNYSSNNSRLEIKGFGANISLAGQPAPIPLPAIYSSADVIYKFPVAFGNIDSSNSSFSLAIPPLSPIATVKRAQKRVNEVDGWGSIITPFGTFDVLRVKSNISRVDSILFGAFPIGVPTTTNEYKWIGKAMKIPVLQINTTVIGANETATAIILKGAKPNEVNNVILNSTNLLLSPNPAINNLKVDFEVKSPESVILEITNLVGQKVAHFEFMNLPLGKHSEILPIQGLVSGNYMFSMKNGNYFES